MTLLSEIMEQPERVDGLFETQRKHIEAIALEIKRRKVRYIYLAARGTSDNAGRYAKYLLGATNGIPIALAAPSLFTCYSQPPRLQDALVIGISQSGRSPDIVNVLDEGNKQGCLTLAITNDIDSPLAKSANLTLDICAGEEKSIAATKTYTAQLMAVAMLSAALSMNPGQWEDLTNIGRWMKETLQLHDKIAEISNRFRDLNRTVVLGRGFNHCTAFEWAIKLKEMTYVFAEAYSFADFQHGPIAIVEKDFPIMVVSPQGVISAAFLELIKTLHNEFQANLVIISNDQKTLSYAHSPLPIPAGIPEWLTPLVCILPAQLFAYHLTLAKGIDPIHLRNIQKVTETL